MGDHGKGVIPATPRAGFARVFGWYNRRLLGKRFHRVHATAGTMELLRSLNTHDGPVVLCCSHSAWWDPLVGLYFQREHMADRQFFSPIDAAQLRRFRFFRKLGLFGIEPDSRDSLDAMRAYLADLRRVHPRLTLGITPQGRFADPREQVAIRPGAAAVAAMMPGARVAAVAIEYSFWQDPRPSIFVHAAEIEPPLRASTPAWHRAIRSGMQRAADTLASLVIARDPSAFQILLGPVPGASTNVNAIHGLWLRIRGRSGDIAAVRTLDAGGSPDRATMSAAALQGGGRL